MVSTTYLELNSYTEIFIGVVERKIYTHQLYDESSYRLAIHEYRSSQILILDDDHFRQLVGRYVEDYGTNFWH